MKRIILLLLTSVTFSAQAQKLSLLPEQTTVDTGTQVSGVQNTGGSFTTKRWHLKKLFNYLTWDQTNGIAGSVSDGVVLLGPSSSFNGLVRAGSGAFSVAVPGTDYGMVNVVKVNSLSPLFTASVSGVGTNTVTVSYTQINQVAHRFFGNFGASTAAPSFGSPLLASGDFANQGGVHTLLHGNASGNPGWGAVDLTSEVTGDLPVTNLNGGTSASSSTYWRGDGTWGTPAGSTYVAGNGLTLSGSTFSNNLITGVAGGQTVIGGVNAGDQLLIEGSSAANTGNVTNSAIKYIGSVLNGSSVAQTFMHGQCTVNQTSTAGYTALKLSVIETANGSGANSFVEFFGGSAGTTSKWRVDNTGAVKTGIWNGTVVSTGFGGTGIAGYVTGDILYASGTNVLSDLAIGSSGNVLKVSGGVPVWTTPDVTATNTITFTNKRWTARTSSTTTVSATPAFNTDNFDVFKVTAQGVNITSVTTNLTGTPVDGDIVAFELTAASGTPSVTWGTSFVNSTVSAPTALSTTTVTVLFRYSTTSSYGNNKWICAKTF